MSVQAVSLSHPSTVYTVHICKFPSENWDIQINENAKILTLDHEMCTELTPRTIWEQLGTNIYFCNSFKQKNPVLCGYSMYEICSTFDSLSFHVGILIVEVLICTNNKFYLLVVNFSSFSGYNSIHNCLPFIREHFFYKNFVFGPQVVLLKNISLNMVNQHIANILSHVVVLLVLYCV